MKFENLMITFFVSRVFLSIYDDLEDLDEIIRKDIIESELEKRSRSIENGLNVEKKAEMSIFSIPIYEIQKNEVVSMSNQPSSVQSKDVVGTKGKSLHDDNIEFDDFLELYLKEKEKHTDVSVTLSGSRGLSNGILKSTEFCLKKQKLCFTSRKKKSKLHQIFEGNGRLFELEKIKMNFKRDKEPLSQSFLTLLKQSSNIAKSDENSLEKWSDIVEVILGVLEIVHMFFFSEDFYSLHIDELKSLSTVNEIDDFLRRAIEDLKSKKFILNSCFDFENTKNFLSLKNSILKEPFDEKKSMKILKYSVFMQLKDRRISELTAFLLQEIRNSKVKLIELNSIILFIFSKYSMEKDRRIFDKFHNNAHFLISIIIILVHLANIEYKNGTRSNSDKFVDRINLLILKSLTSFLYKKEPSLIQKKILDYKKDILQIQWQFDTPLQRNNLVFIDHIIGKRLDLIVNLVIPFFNLTETKDLRVDYKKTGFYYLLRSVKYTYELGEILVHHEST